MEQTLTAISKSEIKELLNGAPTSGQVEVRLRNPKKTGSVTLRDYIANGRKRPYVDKYGNHKVLRITKNLTLNMEEEDDRLTYNQLLHHPKYVRGGNSVLALVNIESESEDFVTKKNKEAEVNSIIKELEGAALYNFARVLLIPIKNGSTPTTIKRAVYEVASADPDRVLSEWNSPDREIKELLHNGIDKGVFTNVNRVYSFRGETIGTSFDMAVSWLKHNDDLIPSIRKELK